MILGTSREQTDRNKAVGQIIPGRFGRFWENWENGCRGWSPRGSEKHQQITISFGKRHLCFGRGYQDPYSIQRLKNDQNSTGEFLELIIELKPFSGSTWRQLQNNNYYLRLASSIQRSGNKEYANVWRPSKNYQELCCRKCWADGRSVAAKVWKREGQKQTNYWRIRIDEARTRKVISGFGLSGLIVFVRWRNGETVPVDERCEVNKTLPLDLNLSAAHGRGDGMSTPSLCDTPVSSATNPNISDARYF